MKGKDSLFDVFNSFHVSNKLYQEELFLDETFTV